MDIFSTSALCPGKGGEGAATLTQRLVSLILSAGEERMRGILADRHNLPLPSIYSVVCVVSSTQGTDIGLA